MDFSYYCIGKSQAKVFEMVKLSDEAGNNIDNVKPSDVIDVAPKEVTHHQSNELAAVNLDNNSITKVNLFDEKQVLAAEAFMNRIMRSEKGGIKSASEGLAVLMRAQDLNLPFSTCLEHIHVINGKTGVDVHIIKALLLRAGCTWECIKDYQPLYEYTDGINVFNDNSFPDYAVRCKSKSDAEAKAAKDADGEFIYLYPVKFYKDFNNNIYREYQLTNKFTVVRNAAQAKEAASKQLIPIYRIPSVPVDFITEYKFTRVINGKEVIAYGKFTYSEAVAADLFSKDTYKKYARVLISHRAFTYGARDIASDYIFVVMETTELNIVSNQQIDEQSLNETIEMDDGTIITRPDSN
jgi:hypothetical protein